VAVPLLLAGDAAGRTVHRAGVVVQHGDLGTLTDCVSFSERELDGVELIDRSAFDYRAARFPEGKGICWLDGEGCKTTDPDDCFCTPAEGTTRSWSYWVQEEGDRPLIHHGETYPSGRVIHDGSVDYWTFGPHGMPPTSVPSFEEICGS
jgi:hypothetical protein